MLVGSSIPNDLTVIANKKPVQADKVHVVRFGKGGRYADQMSKALSEALVEASGASWLRGCGWALYKAVSGLAYYWNTNPGMIRQASHALAQLLADSSP